MPSEHSPPTLREMIQEYLAQYRNAWKAEYLDVSRYGALGRKFQRRSNEAESQWKKRLGDLALGFEMRSSQRSDETESQWKERKNAARDELVAINVPLLIWAFKKETIHLRETDKKDILDDCMQEGRMTLLKHAPKYDPERGFTFGAYVGEFLLESIRKEVRQKITCGIKMPSRRQKEDPFVSCLLLPANGEEIEKSLIVPDDAGQVTGADLIHIIWENKHLFTDLEMSAFIEYCNHGCRPKPKSLAMTKDAWQDADNENKAAGRALKKAKRLLEAEGLSVCRQDKKCDECLRLQTGLCADDEE